MSRRQDEKERRRQERMAQERAAAQAAQRKKLVGFGAGALLVVALVGALAFVLLSGGDDAADPQARPGDTTSIPARQTTGFEEAVRASGCEYRSFPSEGRTHSEQPFDGYRTNPPTSGTHNPVPAEDGIYEPGNSPDPEAWVHTLEHGRVLLQYRPGTDARRIRQLETLFNEPVKGADGYHTVVMENNTEMPYEVAAVSWTRMLGCRSFDDRAWDALRAFRERFVDKAPEFIP